MNHDTPLRYLDRRTVNHQQGLRPRCLWALLLGLLMLGLSAGCVPNKMYRPVNIEHQPDYTLAFIEFDDQGELWAPSQVSRTLEAIDRANQNKNGSAVIVFVHGWKDNASQKQEEEKDTKLYQFKNYLSVIRRYQERTEAGNARTLIGVYVSWRGKTGKGLLFPFTFYGRSRAATRIASGPTIVNTMTRIALTAKQNPRSKVIIVGHSFGGWIVERGASQTLVGHSEIVRAGKIETPIDLVLLLNPASPSIQAKQVLEVFGRERLKVYRVDKEGHRFELPLLISITSKTDWATGVAYPIGAKLGTLGLSFRDYGPQFCSPYAKQRAFYTHTPGHQPPLYSHIVTAEPLPAGVQPLPDWRYVKDPESGQPAISFDGPRHRFTIKRKPRALNDTPYWIMSVPHALIKGHAGIFNENALALYLTLAGVTGVLLPESTIIVTRETGLRPIGLAVRSSGELLFADASRRLFAVPKGRTDPLFLACIPPGFDPTDIIGGFRDQDTLVIVFNTQVGSAKKVEYRTEMFPLSAANLGAGKIKLTRFEGGERFYAATVDPEAQKAYLAAKNEIYVADVTQRSPKPEPLLRVDTPGQLSDLKFDAANKRLLALDSRAGRLYLVDLQTSPPTPRLGIDGLGSPAESEVLAPGRIYVSDVADRQIWEITCDASRCSKRVFARSDAFRAPTQLALAPDGTVWVGDPEAGRLFAIAPDGTVKETVSSLAGSQ